MGDPPQVRLAQDHLGVPHLGVALALRISLESRRVYSGLSIQGVCLGLRASESRNIASNLLGWGEFKHSPESESRPGGHPRRSHESFRT